MLIEEDHQAEQYFFSASTLEGLSAFIDSGPWESVACLCCPMLGSELEKTSPSLDVVTLDRDERFSHLTGFQPYNLGRPNHIDRKFDLIVCDPPFFQISLSTLFKAIRTLSHNDFSQNLLLTYLSRRSSNVCGTFTPFQIRDTMIPIQYLTVQESERNLTHAFTNLESAEVERLSYLLDSR